MVKRIVANIKTNDLPKSNQFYQEILELDVLMDHGWIKTLGNEEESKVQISFAVQGGNDTDVPDLSIEVDNIEEIYDKMKKEGFKIVYDITNEDWGVRRFFVEDPFGKVINILSHK
ncbi:Glyoxalase-like domain-containing protein [Chryseobacterium ureilyticum]|uniref:Glyoxalase-like domain-containing protein n=1 Tax=Chryseobacterium ureilyticum TaxID=373668 RepID=A0A1N7KQ09_9FLAO|nr:VOC family protein [Chryseobacterium ureilyticum]SIS63732.1 Glyoxalase-like domain-containing protein [Chryseobacterium ureilyticum]